MESWVQIDLGFSQVNTRGVGKGQRISGYLKGGDDKEL